MQITRELLTLILIGVSIFDSTLGRPKNSSLEECSISLDLSSVGLKNLQSGFVKNKFVTHLTLDDNEIPSVSSEAFSFVPQLSYLSLAGNNLTTLNLEPFSELLNLDTLNLNRNCEAEVTERYRYRYDDYDFETYQAYEYCSLQFDAHLRSLKNLSAEHNDIKTLSFDEILPTLTHLYLSHNPLLTDPATLSRLNSSAPSLTHLYLQHCHISGFHASELSAITSLYLDNNEIKSICNAYSCEDSSLKLNGAEELEELSLSNNQISIISPDSFIYTKKLTKLDLSHNQISEIRSGTFDNLYMLQSLSLEQNKLMRLGAEDTFKDLIKLETLSLGDNQISMLGTGIFKNLSALKKLVLKNNKISSIDSQMFSKLNNLEVLSLAGNQISVIPEGSLASSGSLISLDLDNNAFTSTNDISLSDQPRMSTLSLRKNPLGSLTARWIVNIGSENLTITVSHS